MKKLTKSRKRVIVEVLVGRCAIFLFFDNYALQHCKERNVQPSFFTGIRAVVCALAFLPALALAAEVVRREDLPPVRVGDRCVYRVQNHNLVTTETHRVMAVDRNGYTVEVTNEHGSRKSVNRFVSDGNPYSFALARPITRLQYPLSAGNRPWPVEYESTNNRGGKYSVRLTATVIGLYWQVVPALSSQPVKLVEVEYVGFSDEDLPGDNIRHVSSSLTHRLVYAPESRCTVSSRATQPQVGLNRVTTLVGYLRSETGQD